MERENEQRFKLDEASYVMVIANAAPAFEMSLALLATFEGLTLALEDKALKEFPVGQIFKALASPEFKRIREFLLSHVTVSPDGKPPYRLDQQANIERYMNEYPAEYVPLLMRALQFQFARFFPGGGLDRMLRALQAQLRRANFQGVSTGLSTNP